MIYFITGLPGTGKTTAGEKLCEVLVETTGVAPIHLDGDNMRKCWKLLGYSKEERLENISRIENIAALFKLKGLDIVVSVVAPSAISRDEFRKFHEGNYTEILLTKIHEKRPDHYYPNYEPSTTPPEYIGEKGFEKLLKELKK
jgi:adenylylsulfate kinase